MSKLSRKEFKELICEWNQNFVNEKYQNKFTKDSFQNIHSLNTKGEVFPELNIDVIEYTHEYAEVPESVDKLLSTKYQNRDDEGGGFIFSKSEDRDFIKQVLNAFIEEEKIEDKSYEGLLNNSNGLIISPAGMDNEFMSKNSDSIASKRENSSWMLHDTFHSLLKNQEWTSTDGEVNSNTLVDKFYLDDEDTDYDMSTGNIITDYFNDHLTHKNIKNHIRRSVDSTDHLFDMPMFIFYFTLHIENGVIDNNQSLLKLENKLSQDFLSHNILSQVKDKSKQDYFIKYMVDFQKFVIDILNQFNENPIVYIKVED